MARNEAVSDQEVAVCFLQAHYSPRSQCIGGISSRTDIDDRTRAKERHSPAPFVFVANILDLLERFIRNGVLLTESSEEGIYVPTVYAGAAADADDGIISLGIVGGEGRC